MCMRMLMYAANTNVIIMLPKACPHTDHFMGWRCGCGKYIIMCNYSMQKWKRGAREFCTKVYP